MSGQYATQALANPGACTCRKEGGANATGYREGNVSFGLASVATATTVCAQPDHGTPICLCCNARPHSLATMKQYAARTSQDANARSWTHTHTHTRGHAHRLMRRSEWRSCQPATQLHGVEPAAQTETCQSPLRTARTDTAPHADARRHNTATVARAHAEGTVESEGLGVSPFGGSKQDARDEFATAYKCAAGGGRRRMRPLERARARVMRARGRMHTPHALTSSTVSASQTGRRALMHACMHAH